MCIRLVKDQHLLIFDEASLIIYSEIIYDDSYIV